MACFINSERYCRALISLNKANNKEGSQMTERLVDVIGKNGEVVHTYPVTVGKPDGQASDSSFEIKALQAASYGHLVPTDDLVDLTARMHVSRRGPLQPYGDNVPCSSQTKVGLEQEVREDAYRLWAQSGQPDGNADEYWKQAHDHQLRLRAYMLWQQEGSPEGRSEEFWNKTAQFEAF